jgi:hypothetical protein
LAGCEEEHYCNFAFDFLGKLLQDCGIEESVDKACLGNQCGNDMSLKHEKLFLLNNQ